MPTHPPWCGRFSSALNFIGRRFISLLTKAHPRLFKRWPLGFSPWISFQIRIKFVPLQHIFDISFDAIIEIYSNTHINTKIWASDNLDPLSTLSGLPFTTTSVNSGMYMGTWLVGNLLPRGCRTAYLVIRKLASACSLQAFAPNDGLFAWNIGCSLSVGVSGWITWYFSHRIVRPSGKNRYVPEGLVPMDLVENWFNGQQNILSCSLTKRRSRTSVFENTYMAVHLATLHCCYISAMVCQITGISTVCSTAYPGWHHRNFNAHITNPVGWESTGDRRVHAKTSSWWTSSTVTVGPKKHAYHQVSNIRLSLVGN